MHNTLSHSTHRTPILFIAHNHPKLFPGGAEILAYDMFNSFRDNPSFKPYFLAASSRLTHQMHVGTAFQAAGENADEILFWGDQFDYFNQSQRLPSLLHKDFAELLKEINPAVVHFHHTLRIGMEALKVVKTTLPNARIVYTLHDYIPICHRDGQMVRTKEHELCDHATPIRCHQCFPDISPQRFKIRELFIKTHFDLVDQFVSPSHFLAKRYQEWGMPEERITVISNGSKLHTPVPHRSILPWQKRNRFAFFGQITPYKGANVLMEAARSLVEQGYTDFNVDIYGNISLQLDDFKERFYSLLKACEGHVTFHGKYRNEELPHLIKDIDWVIMPSTWWENAPLVIGEVFQHKRPIICSNIGGMKEKVTEGTTGLHFKTGNSSDLARVMRRACEERGLWKTLVRNITPPCAIEACTREHEKLYGRLLG